MQMEVTITSTDHIKPSSPTPNHLRNYKLSLLDQFIPVPYVSIIFFYSPDTELNHHLSNSSQLQLLKKSLSQTLTHFYPLAGKLRDDLTIDCSDEGAYYVETKVGCSLSELLARPDLLSLRELLPVDRTPKETYVGTNIANIQANVFKCGGIALGLSISHKILDGAALSAFLRGWSATACCKDAAVVPDFAATSLFHADDLWLRDTSLVMWRSLIRKGNSKTRRFLFDGSAIDTLKNTARGPELEHPTRVEVVSAFIWERCMVAWETRNGIPRPSILHHAVNLRKRMDPPLPDRSIGNILWISSAKCAGNSNKSLPVLAQEVRKSISKIDRHFVEHLQGAKGNAVVADSLREMRGTVGSENGADHFLFSSWCKFGFYEADFGWGTPVWVSSTGFRGPVFMDFAILVDTKEGDGIEAWVTLDESEMGVLEDDGEIRRLVSIDPSPLTYNVKN